MLAARLHGAGQRQHLFTGQTVEPIGCRFRSGTGARGAFEIAGRFSRMDLDDQDIRGGVLNDVGLALNWYPTSLTRVF